MIPGLPVHATSPHAAAVTSDTAVSELVHRYCPPRTQRGGLSTGAGVLSVISSELLLNVCTTGEGIGRHLLSGQCTPAIIPTLPGAYLRAKDTEWDSGLSRRAGDGDSGKKAR